MLNKKGMIAAEEIFGMLWFVFVAAIMVLIFYGSSIQRVVVDSNEWEFSKAKAEIEATKALNFFLGMPHPTDSEKLVLDLVIESDIGNMRDLKYLELIKKAEEYFTQLDFLYNPDISWNFDVDDQHVVTSASHIDTHEPSKAEITIPYMDENFELKEKTVSFDYIP